MDEMEHKRKYTTKRNTEIKVVPLQDRCGPEGSRSFRLPDFHDIRHIKVVRSSASRTGRLYLQECSWYSFSDLYILAHRKSLYKHSLMYMHLVHVRRRYAIERSAIATISNSYSVVRV